MTNASTGARYVHASTLCSREVYSPPFYQLQMLLKLIKRSCLLAVPAFPLKLMLVKEKKKTNEQKINKKCTWNLSHRRQEQHRF